MPNYRLSDRQKHIIRAFLNGLRNKPDKIEWSYDTMPSDDNRSDLAVCINTGIPAVDEIQDIYKSDLKLFGQIGLISPIPGRSAFRIDVRMIRRYAK